MTRHQRILWALSLITAANVLVWGTIVVLAPWVLGIVLAAVAVALSLPVIREESS